MKKRFLFLLAAMLVLSCANSYAQTFTDTTKMMRPDKYPEFKNGLSAWTKFLEKTLDRDLPVKMKAPPGRYTVIASFLVDSVGGVRDIQIEFDRGYGTGEEVKRVIGLTDKKWIPAIDNNNPVSFRHRQSITFIVN